MLTLDDMFANQYVYSKVAREYLGMNKEEFLEHERTGNFPKPKITKNNRKVYWMGDIIEYGKNR